MRLTGSIVLRLSLRMSAIPNQKSICFTCAILKQTKTRLALHRHLGIHSGCASGQARRLRISNPESRTSWQCLMKSFLNGSSLTVLVKCTTLWSTSAMTTRCCPSSQRCHCSHRMITSTLEGSIASLGWSMRTPAQRGQFSTVGTRMRGQSEYTADGC